MMPDVISTVVTKRDEGVSENIQAKTPGDQPNVNVIVMPAWQRVLVRTARVYLQSLAGFIIAGGTGLVEAATDVKMPIGNFLQLLIASASLAVAPAALTLLQNAVELLAKFDETRPTMRG
jgi:hypothetical protein